LASGTYSDGRSGVDISSQVTWTSSDPTVATVSAAGSAAGVAIGSTKITATLGAITSQSRNVNGDNSKPNSHNYNIHNDDDNVTLVTSIYFRLQYIDDYHNHNQLWL
jgi:uncharacterized protein YjdB